MQHGHDYQKFGPGGMHDDISANMGILVESY